MGQPVHRLEKQGEPGKEEIVFSLFSAYNAANLQRPSPTWHLTSRHHALFVAWGRAGKICELSIVQLHQYAVKSLSAKIIKGSHYPICMIDH
jgi:hypothetical protein